VQANLLAMEKPEADGKTMNIGSGAPVTIREVAGELARALGTNVPCDITGKYRAGDVRHCFADISAAAQFLGYKPRVGLKEGIAELAGWLESQQAKDSVDEAMQHLAVHGLVA
jgi:dTDP-L-rhamnose 4-epimerase